MEGITHDMTPATKDDVEKAKIEVIAAIKDGREQHSAEHGAIITRVDDQNKDTRGHIGNEVETVRADIGHMKNFLARMLKAMKRFLERHGMGADDL